MNKVEKQKEAIRKLAKRHKEVNLLGEYFEFIDLVAGIKDIETTKRLCKEIRDENKTAAREKRLRK